MKIAIVGPSPVPFTMGGMENLIKGLYQTITETTEHQVELIKIPTREFSFWELIDSYYKFYKLDLSHFDLIISNKYPAWMVQHDNVIFYVAHRLRGLYDTYHLTGMPEEVDRKNHKINDLLDYMHSNPMPESLDTFFEILFTFRNDTSIPERFFTFPGPLIREIVHYMDDYAFLKPHSARYFSISETVKKRKGYFPSEAEVKVVYPPSELKKYTAGDYKYLFMVSRLDAPKRIDMLIRAMKYVKSDVALYIAGIGPERSNLEKLAKGDSRIKFLGFVSNEDVENYYSNCLAVPYFPYDEDYGLITFEAMMHKKPVITTVDAGGPTEFVKNGETGYCVQFEEKAIAEKIDYFAGNPKEAKRMGENGFHIVKDTTWKNVVEQLLREDGFDKNKEAKKGKITVTSTFPIYPPQGGGQSRIYNLYRQIAKEIDVEIVSYTNFDLPGHRGEVAKGLVETRIPRSKEHQEKLWKLEAKAKFPLSDIAEITLGVETKEYFEALQKSLNNSTLCVVSHPYLYHTVKGLLLGKPFVYEAHNVESVMKESMLPASAVKKQLVQQVFDTEKECCERAALIMTCSEEDGDKLSELYGVSKDKIVTVPNGVDTTDTVFVTPKEREANKIKLGLENEKVGLFMGSWHEPNLRACEMIFNIAEKCPDTKFLLMGSQCDYFRNKKIPPNVAMLGVLSEEGKKSVFATVDFALNPMQSGSGTNLKMFDYMAAGIPVISTLFGTRGIERKDLFIIADNEKGFVEAINRCIRDDELIFKARAYVESEFDWRRIAENVLDRMKNLFM